ncbi:MAG: hypothetical protein WA093_00905 [Minisyncoccales bacterium]
MKCNKEEIESVGPLVSTCNDVEAMLIDNNMSNNAKKTMGHQALGMAIWRLNDFGENFTEKDKKEFKERVQGLRDRLNSLETTRAVEVPIIGTGFTMKA